MGVHELTGPSNEDAIAKAHALFSEREPLLDGANGREARSAAARARVADLAPINLAADPDGSRSLRALTAKLTAEGLPTPAGAAVWTAACVARVKAKLAA